MRPPRSLSAVLVLLLAALAAASPDADLLRREVLQANDPAAAVSFLRDGGRQAALKNEDPALFAQVFARATELDDVYEFTPRGARAIRLAVSARERCSGACGSAVNPPTSPCARSRAASAAASCSPV